MKDSFGRNIDYLRISVTDKCNLRCQYCMPANGVTLMPHDEMLTLEEIARLVGVFAKLGVKKVRITGGEPMVRKNLIKLIKDIHDIAGIEEICMTTNGILFADHVEDLWKAGLTHVNISLDTLQKDTFRKITGMDGLEKVMDALEKALYYGMVVKLNCVPCEEFNKDDLTEIALLARKYPIDVRYIELMPIGCGKNFHGIASDAIQMQLEQQFGIATPVERADTHGPARYIRFSQFQGKIGFISPMSHKFCNFCNRVRLTAEGQLKLCLNYEKGIDLKRLLRSSVDDTQLKEIIEEAVMKKPEEHDFENENGTEKIDQRKMHQIGG